MVLGNIVHWIRLRNTRVSRKNQEYSYSILFSFKCSVYALEESAEFLDIAFRYKLDTACISHHLHFLARLKMQDLSN